MQPQPVAGSDNVLVHLFELDMTSSQCGYPICCPGDQPKFKEVPFFPTQVSKLGIEHELKAFMKECEDVFHSTGMPMCPCMCHHFCIPFSPVCAMFICAARRKSGLEEAVQKFNTEIAQPRGIFVQWNQDCYQQMSGGGRARGRRGRGRGGYGGGDIVIHIHVPHPGLEVFINKPQRMKFCSENGVPYEEPVAAAPPQPPQPAMQGGYAPPPGQPMMQQPYGYGGAMPMQAQMQQVYPPGQVPPPGYTKN